MLRRVLKFLDSDPYGDLRDVNTGSRLKKLASPNYLSSKALLWAYERTHPDMPWITRDATRLLDAFLAPDGEGRRTKRALEWGSGRSTVWLAVRCLHLTTIEHHPIWQAKVMESLRTRHLENVDLRLVDETGYAQAAADLPRNSLDFILVDGLQRDVTWLASLRLLRPGGWLMLDNANWYLPSSSTTPHSRSVADGPLSNGWDAPLASVQEWQRVWTTNGVNDTAIFVRPIP